MTNINRLSAKKSSEKVAFASLLELEFEYCCLTWMFLGKAVAIKLILHGTLALKDTSVTVHNRHLQFLAIELFKVCGTLQI